MFDMRRLRPSPLTGRSFQDALRAFFQPIKTDDPRVDFYTMYKREATEYDANYIKKYDDDLNMGTGNVPHGRVMISNRFQIGSCGECSEFSQSASIARTSD